MRAFDHISGTIDRIYKDLTVSRTHPVGGAAYLSLESEEEPFLHGIKFTAMPPTKRFRDMEQLSGGEKTVAALALLFAIHRCASTSNRKRPVFLCRPLSWSHPKTTSHFSACFIRFAALPWWACTASGLTRCLYKQRVLYCLYWGRQMQLWKNQL